jgi:hypothetical protein
MDQGIQINDVVEIPPINIKMVDCPKKQRVLKSETGN